MPLASAQPRYGWDSNLLGLIINKSTFLKPYEASNFVYIFEELKAQMKVALKSRNISCSKRTRRDLQIAFMQTITVSRAREERGGYNGAESGWEVVGACIHRKSCSSAFIRELCWYSFKSPLISLYAHKNIDKHVDVYSTFISRLCSSLSRSF